MGLGGWLSIDLPITQPSEIRDPSFFSRIHDPIQAPEFMIGYAHDHNGKRSFSEGKKH